MADLTIDSVCPECGKRLSQVFAEHLRDHLVQTTEPEKEFERVGEPDWAKVQKDIAHDQKKEKKAFDKKAYMQKWYAKNKAKKKGPNLPGIIEKLEVIDKKRKKIAKTMPEITTTMDGKKNA